MRLFCTAVLLSSAISAIADPVTVVQREGLVHGFLAMRDADHNLIASGDLSQTTSGNRVTSQLVFHFRDGSVRDETSVFTDQKTFRLVAYRLIQKGPSFKTPMDLSLNVASGQVTIHYMDDGKEKTISEKMKLPSDLANGLTTTLLKNIDPKTPKSVVSMLVATPKPRIVKLEITPAEEDIFSVTGAQT